jgi:DNA-binding transcriptional ArsR family regulator
MGRPAITTSGPQILPEHELLARIFRTLGDATRLRLLEALDEVGSATQSELMTLVGATQSRASEHLSCLTWCGLVEATRDGRSMRYSLTDGRAAEMVATARAFMAANERAVGGCTPAESQVVLDPVEPVLDRGGLDVEPAPA